MNSIFHTGVLLGVLFLAGRVAGFGLRAADGPVPEADLFRPGAIPSLRIQLEEPAADSLRQDPREFVTATVSEGERTYPQVALHLKGSRGSFRPFNDKPALTLDFCRFQTGRKFHGLRRIYLNNSVEDPSYVNEKLGSEFFQSAGLPAPRVTRALVALNGGAPRLYVLIEGFTEDFLGRHFSQITGELYEPGPGRDIDEKLSRNSVAAPFDRERSALKNLAAAVRKSDPAQRWQALTAALDTRRFFGFMAAEVMLGHRDGYCINRNNYRVYHDLDSGRIVFFPHGMDQLLGTAELPWQPNWSGLVAQAVMSTPEGQQGYAATFGGMLTNQFKVKELTNRVDELLQELRPVLGRDDFAGVEAASALVKERLEQRKSSLVAQWSRPPLKLLEFSAGGAHPETWEIGERPAEGMIDQANCDGLTALHISALAGSLASWRTTVLLPPGRYRFTDRVRLAGVEPLPLGEHSGVELRVGGRAGAHAMLTGDSGWRDLSADFEVRPPMEKVELICELRARAGEVWFDLAALRVLQTDKKL
jgi:hypothetical protein